MGEISIRQFLTREESRDLVNRLEKIGIKAWTHPMTSGEGDLDINQVFIDELDVVKSKETLDIFNKIVKSKTLIDKFSCPKCKAKLPHIVYKDKLSFIQKMLSLGTKTLECKKCGTKWYI